MTPSKAIHAECKYCMGGYSHLIKDCTSVDCKLYNFRNGKRENEEPLTPLKAMRLFCLDCTGGQRSLVNKCPNSWCNIYPFRMGKRPKKEALLTV